MQPGTERPFQRARLRYDSDLFLQLQLCNEWGIPHSEFLSWDPEDKAKALAFSLEKSSRCEMCGTAEWEWEENRYAYEPVEHFCMGCYLKHMAGEDGGSMPGTTITLLPSTGRSAAKRRVDAKRKWEARRRG